MSELRSSKAQSYESGQALNRSSGPPWILGWRGAPLDAPENTSASFLRALESGLDGIHYDLRACSGGDLVVLRDARLDRTTDGDGALSEHTLSELFALDAGGWFSKEFTGEPLPHFDDVLELCSSRSARPLHFIELHEPEWIEDLARRIASVHPPPEFRVASPRRDVCLELRDLGLHPVLIAERAEESELAFVRDERIEGLALTTPEGWRTEMATRSWPCERWLLGIDDADDLFAALGDGIYGITTSEARRALALRTLNSLNDGRVDGPPLQATPLPVLTNSAGETSGEWRGEWAPRVQLFNPLPFDCRVLLELYVRRGVFEREGLPRSFDLASGEEESVHFALRGGSWSPGGDPLLAALFEWSAGPGRAAGRLLFDISLRRERSVVADVITQRLEMLRESPGQPRASMTLRRRAGRIALHVENPGELRDLRIVAQFAGRTWTGGATLQLPLPPDFDSAQGGLPFGCGFYGRNGSSRSDVLRRWCAGIPAEPGSGGLGRMFSRVRS